MTMHSDTDWTVGEVTEVPGVRHVVVLSADGLVKASSAGTGRDVADRLAAACSGLQSLGQSLGREFGAAAGVRQVMVEFDGGFLFVRTAGQGSHLAVVTGPAVDPALIAQAMQTLVVRIGSATLSTPARADRR